MYSKTEIRDLRARFVELRGLDDSSIDESLIQNIYYNRREAAEKWWAKLSALKAAAQAAYDSEITCYAAKNPTGKNGPKAALRAARKIWRGFGY